MIYPYYLIYGIEPLQKQEKLAAVINLAQENKFDERQIFEIQSNFDWQQLYTACYSLNLFTNKKIIELRLNIEAIPKQGHDILNIIIPKLKPVKSNDCNILIIINAHKINNNIKNTNWYRVIQTSGYIFQSNPIPKHEWQKWVQNRLIQNGYQPSFAVIKQFAQIYEGNLLAADQCIKKIQKLIPQGQLELSNIQQFFHESNQFSVYELIDTALAGDGRKAIQIFNYLINNGLELSIILWAITREIRIILQIHYDLKIGKRLPEIIAKYAIWSSRQSLIKQALERLTITYLEKIMQNAHIVDIIIKKDPLLENANELLLSMYLQLAGYKSLIDFHLEKKFL